MGGAAIASIPGSSHAPLTRTRRLSPYDRTLRTVIQDRVLADECDGVAFLTVFLSSSLHV